MFEALKTLFNPAVPKPKEANATAPDSSAKRRAWVVLEDGRVGYIHHYKIDGKFGVRPVGFESGLHYPNTSEHWTHEQRMTIPEELALTIREFRAATDLEIPPMFRPSLF